MGLPEFQVEGVCQCGTVRYRLKASPLSVYNCHCKDCQRYSGAAWSMSMIVRNEDFELLSGETERYDRRADSGNVIAIGRFESHSQLVVEGFIGIVLQYTLAHMVAAALIAGHIAQRRHARFYGLTVVVAGIAACA